VAGVVVLSGVVLISREISLFRGELRKLNEVSTFAGRATVLRENGGRGEGLAFASRVIEPYAKRSDMKNRIAAFRGAVTSAHSDVQVLEILADKVVRPLDAQAYPMVARAARDTAMGVALSPFGLLDAGLMIWRTLGMVREVAQVYGFRPGFFGQVMLVRRILSTAATAGIGDFAGDVLVAQVGGLLSAKAGEGMLTGMRTARLGLVAMEACRPLSFAEEDRASIVRLGREIMKSKEKPGED
jgi:putative membrane protein